VIELVEQEVQRALQVILLSGGATVAVAALRATLRSATPSRSDLAIEASARAADSVPLVRGHPDIRVSRFGSRGLAGAWSVVCPCIACLVALVGLGLALHSWVTLLATPVISAAILGQRVHAEEQLMTEALGDPYVRYMARTKRFIPFVW